MRFLRQGFCLPPVARRLWRESREIPEGRADDGESEVSTVCGGKIMAVRRMTPASGRRDARDATGARRGGRVMGEARTHGILLTLGDGLAS